MSHDISKSHVRLRISTDATASEHSDQEGYVCRGAVSLFLIWHYPSLLKFSESLQSEIETFNIKND